MNVNLGTTATAVQTATYTDKRASGVQAVVQNLGPGSVYVDFTNTVTSATGLKIAADGAYEFPRMPSGQTIWMVSDSTADVRVLLVD